jgi:hypothetical protein
VGTVAIDGNCLVRSLSTNLDLNAYLHSTYVYSDTVASDILNDVQRLHSNTGEDCSGTSFFGLSIV